MGGAPCLLEGRPGLGAHPPPAARPWGWQPGSAAHMLLGIARPGGDSRLRRAALPRRCEGLAELGALPLLTACPWGW